MGWELGVHGVVSRVARVHGAGLSATPPAKYQERFEERVIRAIIEEKEVRAAASQRAVGWAAEEGGGGCRLRR